MIFATFFLSPIDVFDNEVKRNDYKPMIHNDSATISLGLMNIACTLLIFIKQLHLLCIWSPCQMSKFGGHQILLNMPNIFITFDFML